MRALLLAGLLLGLSVPAAGASLVFTQNRCPRSTDARYCDLLPQLCAVPAAGGPTQRVAAASVDEAWSPDGRLAAWSQPGPWTWQPTLFLGLQQLGPGLEPVFSPDGSQVAFTQPQSGSSASPYQVAVAAADGSLVRRVTTASLTARSPSWSPDGKELAFQLGSQIAVVGADGSGLRTLTDPIVGGGFVATPAWSPDGSTILYMRNTAIWAMRADGSGAHELVAGAEPAWAPDGSRFAFDRDGTVYTAAVGGGDVQPVDPVFVVESKPRWAPDAALSFSGTCDRQSSSDGESMEGSAGIDTFLVANAGVVARTHAGDDAIFSIPENADAPEYIDAGDGDDEITIDGGRATTIGGRGADRIDALGTSEPQRIDAGPGADYVTGGRGDDFILGGDDRDQLFGETGSNTIYGGAGDDVIAAKGAGRASVQHLYGGPGNDVITGGHGPDVLSGGPGNDEIYAFDGVRDVVDCGAGTDDVAYVDRHDVVRNCEFVLRRPR